DIALDVRDRLPVVLWPAGQKLLDAVRAEAVGVRPPRMEPRARGPLAIVGRGDEASAGAKKPGHLIGLEPRANGRRGPGVLDALHPPGRRRVAPGHLAHRPIADAAARVGKNEVPARN